jgi:hypothetical protein
MRGMADKALEKLEKKGLKQLERIEKDLEQIKGSPQRTFLYGIIYGMGAFIGGIFAIILLGWVLSVLGVIPGFERFEGTVNKTYEQVTGR